MVLPGKNIATKPKTMNIIMATNRIPLHTVKSNLVWNANSVNARQTTVVAPTAIKTVSGGTRDVIVPNMKDWAHVNIPNIMKLVGDVRRTVSQHAIAIIETKSTTNEIQNSSWWALRKFFVPAWKVHNEINPTETLNWT